MHPFVIPVGGCCPQKGAFSGNVQKFLLFWQREVCWITHQAQRASVSSGVWRCRGWEHGSSLPHAEAL